MWGTPRIPIFWHLSALLYHLNHYFALELLAVGTFYELCCLCILITYKVTQDTNVQLITLDNFESCNIRNCREDAKLFNFEPAVACKLIWRISLEARLSQVYSLRVVDFSQVYYVPRGRSDRD